jgi:hypothetical protein
MLLAVGVLGGWVGGWVSKWTVCLVASDVCYTALADCLHTLGTPVCVACCQLPLKLRPLYLGVCVSELS